MPWLVIGNLGEVRTINEKLLIEELGRIAKRYEHTKTGSSLAGRKI